MPGLMKAVQKYVRFITPSTGHVAVMQKWLSNLDFRWKTSKRVSRSMKMRSIKEEATGEQQTLAADNETGPRATADQLGKAAESLALITHWKQAQRSKLIQIFGMDFERPMNLLIFAIKGGNLEEVDRILNSHPNELINRLEPQIRQPPLYFAALHSDHEKSFQLTKILVQKGSNPNFQDSLMQSIIFYVARDGKLNCFDYLVSQNVQLDRPDVNGQTPIYYAARDNRYQIVKQLLQRGANVNRIDSLKSQTPLFYAAREGHLQICKLLVQYGSNVSHADNQGKMAIHYARKTSKQEVVQFLTQELGKLRDAKKSNTATSISKDKEDKKIKTKSKDIQPKSAVRLVFTDQKGVSRQILQSQFSELASKFGRVFDMLKNPDSISAQEIQQTLAEPSWQKSAMKVINVCWKAKGGNLFHKPVNPTEYGILDYFDIIKKPMDFSLVKTKLTHNVYTSKEQFKADMNLVFNNCIVYNGLENEVAMCAIEIRNIFLESCRQHKL